MRTRYLPSLLRLPMIVLVLLAACQESIDEPVVTDPDPDQFVEATLLEKINASDSLKVFARIIKSLDQSATEKLSAVLNGTTDYTLFAPINGSEAPLVLNTDPITGAPAFTEDEATLWRAIVRYHLVAGSVLKATDLQDGQTLTTVLGETITISTGDGVLIADATEERARVVRADVLASNGVVHFIDKVLVPQQVVDAPDDPNPQPDFTSNRIREAMAERSELSTLLEAIKLFGMEEELFSTTGVGEGPSTLTDAATIFAPTNDAFAALFTELGDEYNRLADFDTAEEKQLWQELLRYHVSPGASRLATSFSTGDDGEQLTTLIEEKIGIFSQDGTVTTTDSKRSGVVVTSDVAAGDYVIHTTSIVLRPQSFYDSFVNNTGDTRNMPAFFSTRPELSTLVAAIEKVKLSFDYLQEGSGDVSTYFAPNNDAFDKLFVELGDDYNSLDDFDTEAELKTLENILLHQHAAIYYCSESLRRDGKSNNFLARVITPQVPRAPDRRLEVKTVPDANNPMDSVVVIEDDVRRRATIVKADLALDRSVPACAEGVTDSFLVPTSIVHITDRVLLKQVFLTPNNPE